MKKPFCTVIIVTHDSEKFLPKAIESLKKQTQPAGEILLIDSGSKSFCYLNAYASEPNLRWVKGGEEIGFCKANNIGVSLANPEADYILFLNPDAFLFPDFLEKGCAYMEQNQTVGAVTGIALGYDMDKNLPKPSYDTAGVFQTWYGRWYDRGQGEPFERGKYSKEEEIPAICGALFFCRKKGLDTLGEQCVFDPQFFMYKEDIDLSLRLKAKGWRLIFLPHLLAYHCRGWNTHRKQVPRTLRLSSAKNELSIHMRERSIIPIFYSSLKLMAVKYLDK